MVCYSCCADDPLSVWFGKGETEKKKKSSQEVETQVRLWMRKLNPRVQSAMERDTVRDTLEQISMNLAAGDPDPVMQKGRF